MRKSIGVSLGPDRFLKISQVLQQFAKDQAEAGILTEQMDHSILDLLDVLSDAKYENG